MSDPSAVFGTPLPVLALGVLVALAAGIVRGFAGFGFSALTVAGLSLFVAPSQIVAAVLALEVLASVSLIRAASRDADAAWLRWLLIGNALCIPIGIAMLVVLPETLVRLLVGSALFVSAALLRLAGERSFAAGLRLRIGAGVASGLLNGIAASGGVAAALLMTAARVPAAALRGTMITMLLYAGAYALLCAGIASQAGGKSLLGPETLRWALLLGPAMFVGIWIGRRSFSVVDPKRYRVFVLKLLMVISALGAARAALDLMSR